MAQAPSVPVYKEGPGAKPQAALRREAKRLLNAKALLDMSAVAQQVSSRTQCKLALPAPSKTVLEGRELWARARAAHLRIGWYYLCKDCDKWHLDLSGGFAITASEVVTCGHVVGDGKDPQMKEGYLLAVDEDDHVYPVTEVLASNRATDTVVLRLKTTALKPLPLAEDVMPGDAVACFSDPLDRRGVFTTGIINRFMQRPFLRPEELTADEKAHPEKIVQPVFVQVSTDWAPGSSGSAVVDRCGNVIGHVSEVQTELETDDPVPGEDDGSKGKAKAGKRKKKGPPPGTVIVFHDAISVRHVRELVNASPPE